MTLDPARDMNRMIDGGSIHIAAVIDAIMDACDPTLAEEQRGEAIERAAAINPTLTVAMLCGLVLKIDQTVCEATGDKPGEMIKAMRGGMLAYTRTEFGPQP